MFVSVWGLGFRFCVSQCLGFRVWGWGFRAGSEIDK